MRVGGSICARDHRRRFLTQVDSSLRKGPSTVGLDAKVGGWVKPVSHPPIRARSDPKLIAEFHKGFAATGVKGAGEVENFDRCVVIKARRKSGNFRAGGTDRPGRAVLRQFDTGHHLNPDP